MNSGCRHPPSYTTAQDSLHFTRAISSSGEPDVLDGAVRSTADICQQSLLVSSPHSLSPIPLPLYSWLGRQEISISANESLELENQDN